MSIFIIKIIACITMLLDHIKYALPFTENPITVYLGRLSFPLFAFLITEGYIHTSNLKKYYKRLFIFASFSQIPFMCFRTLVGDWKLLNSMFTLLLGLLAITIYDREKNKFISMPMVIFFMYAAKALKADYDWYGVASVFIIYLLKDKKALLLLAYTLLTVLYYYYYNMLSSERYIISCAVSCFSAVIMIMYNGKQGKKLSKFFYWFYPIHMLVIYALSFIPKF